MGILGNTRRSQLKELYEFGPFRLDPAEHLLLCDGTAVLLPPKAFDTLTVLVRRSGHLLEKERLMKALWPDTFVEEANLQQNIALLRKVLGDGIDGRAYIETVPKRGYRFVAAVKTSMGEEPGKWSPGKAFHWVLSATAVVIALVTAGPWFVRLNERPPQRMQRQITANPGEDPVFRAAISPDGRYLAYTDLKGIHLRLIDTGETRSLPVPDEFCFR